ncbi:N/N'-diacetyllegionaminate synthase [Synechococcus sp. MIT S9220]|uniref:N-acetylneuraminate synthase family protein n=1 Tax=unclassified Synechococcus TaxID=2626047 RepID=UPI00164B2E8E|nr:N-acetylneuraminate synthase family protein [Synechococcus sp. MIT S9220]NOL48027.1 N-acetylneuraminate synthase [Synechococcus sp. MIT S9220]QNJ21537.1 N/N'-diacetyllegionaminate synthase [Synechococcus sp. MIT S9220]
MLPSLLQNSIYKNPLIVAEIGINHNGDMGLAFETIAAASESGAQAVKFQNYKTEDFITDKSIPFEYKSQGKIIVESQYEMFKRCELTIDQLSRLKEECDKYDLLFHSTPTSIHGLNDLISIGSSIVKNGSDYLTNIPLVRAMAESNLTVVLSTGMSTLSEIDKAVNEFRIAKNPNLILLHCTSSYPTNPQDVNLRRIRSLENAFGFPVGFSDHSDGLTAALGASILGACWIEKHFTLNKDLHGPDHWFSMNPDELRTMIGSIDTLKLMLGDSSIVPTTVELRSREQYRLSCVASRDLPEGHKICEEDIVFHRPGTGLPPTYSDLLIGLTLKAPLGRGTQLTLSCFN